MEEAKGTKITENYHILKGRTYLEVTVNRINKDKSLTPIESKTIPLPPNVPTWVTQHNLWHHTDHELKMLRILLNDRGEERPTKETLEIWKKSLELQPV